MNKAVVMGKASVVLVVTLLATVLSPPLTVGLAFAGLGCLPAWLVFPYFVISLCFVGLNGGNPATWCLSYIQCVVYGLVLGQAWIRGRLPKTALWLLGVHVFAILVAAIVWPHTGLFGPF